MHTGSCKRSIEGIPGPSTEYRSWGHSSEEAGSDKLSGEEVVKSFVFGSKYRLDQIDDVYVLLPEKADDSTQTDRPQNIDQAILKFWRYGFTINDGELRRYKDLENKKFLNCIIKGKGYVIENWYLYYSLMINFGRKLKIYLHEIVPAHGRSIVCFLFYFRKLPSEFRQQDGKIIFKASSEDDKRVKVTPTIQLIDKVETFGRYENCKNYKG